MVLQRVRLNSGFSQLVRSPRGGRQAFDTVTFALRGVADGGQRGRLAGSGYTFKSGDLIAAAEDLLDGSMLAAAEMWMVLLDVVAGPDADQRWILLLARAHQADVVALQSDHFVGG